MSYGIIEYDSEGLPMCEICQKYFNRVLSHVRQKHDLSARDYKMYFGFDLKKGICSKESAAKSRDKVFENYEKVVENNLISGGKKSRFIVGSEGRTKDKVSQQTRLRLKARLKEDYMINAMKLSGERVGKSGLGNKERWGE